MNTVCERIQQTGTPASFGAPASVHHGRTHPHSTGAIPPPKSLRSGALAMPLLLEPSTERSHGTATDVLTAHDALLEVTGGFGRYQRRALLVASAVEYNFVVALYTGVLLIPRLRMLWAFSAADEALVSTSFFVGCFVGQAAIGALSDRFGRRRTLLVAVPLGWLSSIGMFLSKSVAMLALMRAIAGCLAGGCLITGYVTFFVRPPVLT